MSLPNYDSVKQKIIDTLVGRPEGTEIDPANQQNYELSLLDYVKSVETLSQTPFKGIADENTVPLQPNNSFVSYISNLNLGQSKTFKNFRNQSGQPISVTADTNKSHLIVLVWNTQYWSVEKITIGVATGGSGGGLTVSDLLTNAEFLDNVATRASNEAVKKAVANQLGNNYMTAFRELDNTTQQAMLAVMANDFTTDQLNVAAATTVKLIAEMFGFQWNTKLNPLREEAANE